MTDSPDTIILGGAVLPVTGPPTQAVAVKGERIAAVGARDDVIALRRPGTEIVDLGGATLTPGLIEPHTHPDISAQMYAWVDVSGFTHAGVSGVEDALKEAVSRAEPGSWVFAFGLDPMLTPDIGTWDRDRLDRLAPHNPLVVMLQSMHTVFANSAALRAAGVSEDTPDPGGGGKFLRDGSGRLTGAAIEQPAINVFARHAEQSADLLRSRLADQCARHGQAGITTIGAAGLFVPAPLLPLLEEVVRSQPLRTVAYLHHAQAAAARHRPGDGDDRFRYQGVKFWYDGSPYSGTMLIDEPYLPSPLCCDVLGIAQGTTGHANFETEALEAQLRELFAGGWQVMTHAQGDRGTREILDLYECVLSGRSGEDHRWRLEHCALIQPDQLERAQRLGVTLSSHVNHVRYYGPELRNDILGPERAAGLMPLRSALDAGHRISLHADSPMYPAAPLSLMRTAVTRLTRKGDRLGADQAITAEQALRAVTIDAAWQLFADNRIGSIEPGKLADFTVLARNPLEAPAEDIDGIEVLGTWVGGQPVGA
jgi:predicted amidohydrolase YtcJ